MTLRAVSDTGTRGQYPGTTTNDNALPGMIGEYLLSDIPKVSSVGLTNNVTANIATIALTAGDWDVWINGALMGVTATALGNANFYISSTSLGGNNTNGAVARLAYNPATAPFASGDLTLDIGPWRVSLAAPATYYFTALCGFASGALSAYGCIQARRAR
jgi:hypothetical protein